MNLVQDPWLTFRFRDGREEKLPLNAIANEDVIDFALPRADFYGAAYQFAIGLLQTVFAPEDIEDWFDLYEKPPESKLLQVVFDTAAHAFNMTGSAPLFMQDFEDLLEFSGLSPEPVSRLLIDAPGEETLKKNAAHFIKNNSDFVMSLEMAALALFALQINAPSGGQGHRTGLRGGGPLTTLLQPEPNSPLWQKLWINVLSQEKMLCSKPDLQSSSVFPWLAKTITSDTPGSEVYEHDVHPYHMYWAMPRRIRLVLQTQDKICSLSGTMTKVNVDKYVTKNYGYNYSGTWCHPLTPYRWNPKKSDESHWSVKAKESGITYNLWDNLTLTSSMDGQSAAKIVVNYNNYLVHELFSKVGLIPRLWVFGFEMDNMKAKSWHSVMMPIFQASIADKDNFFMEVKALQNLASNALKCCREQLKKAWFERPKEIKGNMSFIDIEFWQRTEWIFYETTSRLAKKQANMAEVTEYTFRWLKNIRCCALDIFDRYALSEFANARSMAKCIQARKRLVDWLLEDKSIKSFLQEYNISSDKEKF
ncbi:type I-E CRISPR-associated protein Cse1/CasA [Legionella sp. CNM-4043-24]|uniref:type I-E CRISPR-associated protein Cse1/CasA n=1 Tax=Legionella sp. CNM-4043-24 TaxID=3421646 RepID=UPI00403AA1C1